MWMRIIMSYRFVLDSYAWVEYAIGSKMGGFVDFILKKSSCITPSIVIAELSDKFHRESKLSEWLILFKFIKHNSRVISLDDNLAEKSGRCKLTLRNMQEPGEKKIGLADAIIYQTAIDHNSKLVTGDEHFEKIKNVISLKRIDTLQEIKEKIRNNRKL